MTTGRWAGCKAAGLPENATESFLKITMLSYAANTDSMLINFNEANSSVVVNYN